MKRATLTITILTACPGDDDGSIGDPMSTGSSGAQPTSAADGSTDGLDLGGDGKVPSCVDAYDDVSMLPVPLPLGDTNTSTWALDELVVCDGAPDYYLILNECRGRLSAETRIPEGYVPDLVLYDLDGDVVERVEGWWSDDFKLKPLQQAVGDGAHVLEVRHAAGAATPYSLVITMYYDPLCR